MEIKGPFSYSGNKYRIYKKHLKNSFSKFKKTHEPFCGSACCLYNANIGGIGLDKDPYVIGLHKVLKDENLIQKIEDLIQEYFYEGRRKINDKDLYDPDEYLRLRKDFNKTFDTENPDFYRLHLLIMTSFNSLLRYSGNGYNVPIGLKPINLERLKVHQDIIKQKDFKFIHAEYHELPLEQVDKENDLIYFDPPYAASKFLYNGWDIEDEVKLLKYIDELNSKGFKWVLSNTFKHRGLVNQELIDWSTKYEVFPINKNYNSWSAVVKSVENEKATQEVIVSNFNLDDK